LFADFAFSVADTGEWREGPALPKPRFAHTSLLYGDRIYIYGGDLNGSPLGDLWYFDIGRNEWIHVDYSKKEHPEDRTYATISLYQNKLILVGGFRNGKPLSDVWSFDLGTTPMLSTLSCEWGG
jgi:N-acetylneuraminic acid mutarotase